MSFSVRERVLGCVVLLWAATGLLPGRSAGAQSATEILDNVREAYDAIADARIQFTQTTTFGLSNIENSVHGTLFFKKKNKYRLELKEQTIVTDGSTVWRYSPVQQQVLIDHFRSDRHAITPEKILTGSPEGFTATRLDPGGEGERVVVRLVPTDETASVRSIKLWVDPATWLIRKVELLDVNDARTTYIVREFALNPGLPDAQFAYQIPPGASVVDLR